MDMPLIIIMLLTILGHLTLEAYEGKTMHTRQVLMSVVIATLFYIVTIVGYTLGVRG